MRQGDLANAAVGDADADLSIRTNDIFFNNIDLNRVGVPHADVQMRLFTRVVNELLVQIQPLPRLWYFPGVNRTVMVATADSHINTPLPYVNLVTKVEGAGGRLSMYFARSIDTTEDLDPTTPPAAIETFLPAWRAAGHEMSVHPYFQGEDVENPPFPLPTAPDYFTAGYDVVSEWFNFAPGLGADGPGGLGAPHGPTARHHRVEWRGWVDPVQAMELNDVRMDLSYYTWGRPMFVTPGDPSNQAHGFINGSGLPMRFVDSTGVVRSVYQQVTSLVDEQLVTPNPAPPAPAFSQQLNLDDALEVSTTLLDASQAGGYSAIATQFHVDYYEFGEVQDWVDQTIDAAAARGVPIISAQRWLNYTEARAATIFTNMAWNGVTDTLTFSVDVPDGAEAQTVTLPAVFEGNPLNVVTVSGSAVTPIPVSINGQANYMFSVAAGGAPRTITVTYPSVAIAPSVSVTGVTVVEGNAGNVNAVFQVSLSAAYTAPVTVNYATANGTATAGADYVAASGPVETFAPGQTIKQVTVQVIGDLLVEPNETFTVTLSNPTNAALGTSVATGTITNDDVLPVAVGDSYSTPFGTTLDVPAPGVLANDTGGAAKTATVVATVAHGTLLLGANGSVTYTPTAGYSGPDSFTYQVADGSGTGNIVTVSITVGAPPPGLSITGVTVAEGNNGTVNAVFLVSLSAAQASPVTVNYATANGTATAGADYVAASGPVETFAPGQTLKQVTVQVIGDILDEPNETFTVTLSAATNAVLGTSVATGTITDDDVLPVAVGDSYSTPFGTTLNVPAPGVLANDTGGAKTATVVASVAHGTLLLGANGSVTYTPTAGYSGPDSFTYRVADGSGQGNVVTVSITVGAGAPAAVADSYSTPYQTTLTVAAPGVLANDQDVSVGVTAQLVTSVAHGALTLGANGSVSYTPATGFSGADSFVYRTQSSAGASPAATVTINVVAPTDVQAPQELRVSSIVGNAVTFRWKVPPVGPAPTGFILEGGGAPGQTLVALPTDRRANLHRGGAERIVLRPLQVERYRRTERRVERNPAARQPAGGALGAAGPAGHGQRQHAAPRLDADLRRRRRHRRRARRDRHDQRQRAAERRRARLDSGRPGRVLQHPGAAVNAAGTSAATAPVVVNIPTGCAAAPGRRPTSWPTCWAASRTWSGIRQPPARRPRPTSSPCRGSAPSRLACAPSRAACPRAPTTSRSRRSAPAARARR